MTSIPPSNFKLIEDEFKDIIIKVRDQDQNGLSSNAYIQRKTFIFIDYSKMSVTEFINYKENCIDHYYYDWYDKDKKDLMRFHSEKHDNPAFQTSTEPFHIHSEKILNPFHKRFPNYNFRDLFHIFELIRLIFIYEKKLV